MRGRLLALAAALVWIAPVDAQTPPASGSRIVETARLDPTQGINFASGVWPDRVYIGQQATYEIGIFLSEEMRTRLRRNPQFVPPDVRSMIAYDLPLPPRLQTRTAGGRQYDVHVFARALFPLTAGVHEIGAARLEYAVPLSSSIFAREESHSARSQPHRLLTLEPPAEGRPADYHGAVGRLGLRARLDSTAPRVGDPLLVTLVVSGVGNVSLFPRPQLRIPWGQVVPGPERVQVDSSAVLIAGAKEFDWVVTPSQPGPHLVPEVRYPYFNPYTEQYEVAVTPPLGVRVLPGGLAAPVADARAGAERLTIRRAWRGSLASPIAASPVFWATVVLAPIPALVIRARRRPARSRRLSPRDALVSLSRRHGASPRDIRRQAHAALVQRVPQARPTFGGEGRRMERALRRAGVSAETAHAASDVFARLDEAAYAQAPVAQPDLAGRVLHVLDAVDAEARPAMGSPRRRRRRILGAAFLSLAAAGGVRAAADDARHAAIFASGVAAWDSGAVDEARLHFASVAAAVPRAADAWANLGTASWQAGDTSAAVVGWQRALRLEPVASDVRQRLAATPSFRDGLLGDIPAVPLSGLSAFGLLLWIVGWLALASASRQPWLARQAPRLLVGAAATALIVLVAHERIAGRNQVVVAESDRLREAPAVGAETGALVMAGETAEVRASEGVWQRVRFSDGREGWLERRGLESLAIPAGR